MLQLPPAGKVEEEVRVLGDMAPAVQANPLVAVITPTPRSPARQAAPEVVAEKDPRGETDLWAPGCAVE